MNSGPDYNNYSYVPRVKDHLGITRNQRLKSAGIGGGGGYSSRKSHSSARSQRRSNRAAAVVVDYNQDQLSDTISYVTRSSAARVATRRRRTYE